MYTLKYERKRRRAAKVPKHIPEEILLEILARLPEKSLLRFCCVCRSWNSLFRSRSFTSFHHERNSTSDIDRLLTRTRSEKSFSVFCAKTFAKCLDLDLPSPKLISNLFLHGSCNGLLCISNATITFKDPIYLWNPSIRKIKRLPEGLIGDYGEDVFGIGFGFDPEGRDYKVVRMVNLKEKFEVEVYSLNSDTWRIISAAPPAVLINNALLLLGDLPAYLNGVVFWIARKYPDHKFAGSSIISFNMGSEVFGEIMLPVPERVPSRFVLHSIRELQKSLVVFYSNGERHQLWKLEMDTWKLMYQTDVLAKKRRISIAWPLGFSANGEIYTGELTEDKTHRKLVLFYPNMRQCEDAGIELLYYSQFYLEAYRESLVLLN